MSVQLRDLSDDARVLLGLINHRASLHSTFSAGDVLAAHPTHRAASPGVAAAPLDEREIGAALDELSQDRGWLAGTASGRYVFRALAQDGPLKLADRAAHPST
ncbi:MAG TPA: hypothetical protein VL422_01205 [Miltoncostaea sp.]|nr:hypothetical protein [Miltoncostaea sp.]